MLCRFAARCITLHMFALLRSAARLHLQLHRFEFRCAVSYYSAFLAWQCVPLHAVYCIALLWIAGAIMHGITFTTACVPRLPGMGHGMRCIVMHCFALHVAQNASPRSMA
eukprot:6312185-Pyramimonas_sp.AAC.1